MEGVLKRFSLGTQQTTMVFYISNFIINRLVSNKKGRKIDCGKVAGNPMSYIFKKFYPTNLFVQQAPLANGNEMKNG